MSDVDVQARYEVRGAEQVAERLLAHLRSQADEMTDYLGELVLAESPSTVPESQQQVLDLLAPKLLAAGLATRTIPGRETGGHLFARPTSGARGRPLQLILGHCDTVWPIATLTDMPLRVDAEVLHGPGSFDMKGGLVLGIFAAAALRTLGLELEVAPVFLFTTDEEIGSFESARHIERLARRACRAFVLEPALDPDGKLKTARKGVGRFDVRVIGKSAHGGLEPEAGASAIVELAHTIHELHALSDPDRGITVNVGTIEGGIRPNVVAPESKAVVDVRVVNQEDARAMEAAILGLQATTPGTRLEITGRIGRPPMERTPRNQALWDAARRLGLSLGLQLEEGLSGGASDGNITSLYTATLDGLGAVGDGAHARHEFVYTESLPERAALLAMLMLLPAHPDGAGKR